MRITNCLLTLYLLCCFAACTSYESLRNFSESPMIPTSPQSITNYKPLTIQANDILQISVISTNPVAAQPFNLSTEGSGIGDYLVSSEGDIDFPTIGKIHLEGLEIEAIKDRLMTLLEPYFEQPPIVQVRLTNFKVNVNGEVNNPGSYLVRNDRLSIIDAITLAGDFTSYSMRDSILVIREQGGQRSFGYVSFNSADLFSSDYFYLQQNDVLYVRPAKTKVGAVRDPATRILPWVSALASLTAIIISLSRI